MDDALECELQLVYLVNTPPNLNMEPESDGFPSSESPFPGDFRLQVSMLNFRGVAGSIVPLNRW